MADDTADHPADGIAALRQEIKAEIGFLHDRVNALVGAEAFLTIAYTAAMSSSARWALVVAPVLATAGLLLAALAWPGVAGTTRLVLELTAELDDLTDAAGTVRGAAARRAGPAQRHGVLFFRTAPALFTVTWIVLDVIALVLHRPT